MSAGAEPWKAISTTRSFYFLVEPAYYEQALRIYNKLKWEKSLTPTVWSISARCASVSISTRRAAVLRKKWRPGTRLRNYMDYLLGRVMCCDTVEQLRGYRTAITDEGMLYQGYVARALRRDRMEMRSSAVMRSRCVSLVWRRRRPPVCRPRFRTGNPSGRQFLSRKRPC